MSETTFRPATAADLPAIVAMLADDHLGAQRESPDILAPYERALAEINADPRLLQVVCERDGVIVGTMQLTLVPGLSRQGMTRLQIEGVRVHADHRSGGIGGEMIRWAIAYGRDHGCGLVELTTDKSRADAHRFYERLGFVQSHYGYKLKLM
jgi:GNAT superfamily N-acetyltransferase